MVGSKGSVLIFALLDDEATVSLINERVLNRAGVTSTKTRVHLKCCLSGEAVSISKKKTNVDISIDSYEGRLENIFVVDKIDLPVFSLSPEISQYCLDETGVSDEPYVAVSQMLIGQDLCHLMLCREVFEFGKMSSFYRSVN